MIAELKPTSRENWRTVRFGDVVRNVDSSVRNPLERGIERFVGLEHLDPESLHVKRWGNVADGTSFTRKFVSGQVLFGKRRAYQRKAAVADFDGICSGDILVFEPKTDELLPELLPFVVQSDGFFEHALGTSAGSLSPRTKWSDMARYEFALPPKDEQRRIAEILWATDDEKQTVAAALEKLKETAIILETHLFDKKNGDETTFGELLKKKILEYQTGPFGTVLKASDYSSSGTPIINPHNMKDGRIVIDGGPFLDEKKCELLSRYKTQIGDVVLGRKGDVGRGVFITEEYNNFIVGSDCIRIRLFGDLIDKRYFYYFLKSAATKNWISRLAFGTTMPGINEGLLSRIEIAIPKKEIQQKTVELLDKIENTQTVFHQKLESNKALKQSLLEELLSK